MQEKEWHSLQHLGVVVIKKGALRSPSTTVTNFTYFHLYE